ncbi:helix-turn-helix domain-containing protein [Nocardia brasiliensis]|uniref:helix-turn-helix domain-containing protein n=1 Tax=Nocardia brasiliensis TaxID=37326 RepID=UPI003D8F8649
MIVTNWTGIEVRALRTVALRVTQEKFAEILGFTTAAVVKWEGRRETITLQGRYAATMDRILRRLDHAQLARFESALSSSGLFACNATELDPFENPTEIAGRVQSVTEMDADSDAVAVFSLGVDDVVDRYELEGPRRLAPGVIESRRQVEALLQHRRNPAQLRQLYDIAGRLSGVLGYMAVNRGRFAHAKMYCREAFAIGQLLGDPELQAWVRGTESFCAYYQGDYAAAVRLAYQGLDLAGQGPQAIRLYSNGLARALGKVGDTAGVEAAIEAATAVAQRLGTSPSLTPALDFTPYGEARLMANAATAFLSAGDYGRALHFGQQVQDRVDESDSVWSRSLVRLDMAAALLGDEDRDVEYAVQLGIEALTASQDRPIRSVWQRANDLAVLLRTIPTAAATRYLDELETWAPAAREFAAPEL